MQVSFNLRRLCAQKSEVGPTAGLIQVYTGDGKGKTTAALGLVLRAVGAGWRVFVGQFLKAQTSCELAGLQKLGEQVTVRRYGGDRFIRSRPTAKDRAAARAGLDETAGALASGEYQLVVLDEANVAVQLRLFSVDLLLRALAERNPATEAVVTGRHAHPKLIAQAHLATEMREIKHYHTAGVKARKGIDK